MPHPTRRQVTVILDRSGSMYPIKADTEGGLRAFLAEQHNAPGETLVSLYEFDHHYGPVYEYVALADVVDYTLHPGGNTALFDAIGKTVTDMRAHFDAMPDGEQPAETVVVILTDGAENASQEWRSRTQIRHLIEEQTKRGWKFFYLGAAPDTFTVAGGLGFDRGNTLHYGTDRTEETLTRTSRTITRGGGFTDEDRDATRH
ncbi:hypothetical protein ACIBKY_51365 [Nonomuraea sp. NPDC050394]|uniref:hypothetical protein n=1 Tax=Nonomuraea sp. NPDC050394 TaxID=3364363 RepID=UPI0037B576A3